MAIRQNSISHKYVFVGTVPKVVEKELAKIKPDTPISDFSAIEEFYGADWKNKLGLDAMDSAESKSAKKPGKRGGDDDLGLDLVDDEFSFDKDVLDKDTSRSAANASITEEELNKLVERDAGDVLDTGPLIDAVFYESAPLQNSPEISSSTQIHFIMDAPRISIYPFDKIAEFKKKLYVATKIPIYRQHIWIANKTITAPLSYNVSVGGVFVPVDIRKIVGKYVNGKLGESDAQIENIPLNTDMYNAQARVKIESHDDFKIMEEYYTKYGATEFNLADMGEFLPSNNRQILDAISKSKHQTNLLYYGFVVMYWPMLTIQAFRDYLKGEINIKNFYPDLFPDIKVLESMYSREKDILDVSLDLHTSQKESALKAVMSNLATSITSATINVSYVSNTKEKVIFTRNLLDSIELNEHMDACRCLTNHEDKTFVIDKVYNNSEPIKETLSTQSIAFRINPPDANLAPVIVIFYRNGNYAVKSTWREEANHDFDSIFKEVKKLVDPLVDAINKLAHIVLYEGMRVSQMYKYNTKFVEIGMNIYYKQIFTESQFAFLKFLMEEYRTAGLMNSRNVEKNYAEFYFRKGMYQFDPRRIEKITNIRNYYEHMSDGIIKQKWYTIFEKTRITKVWHRFSDIKIEIYGIKEKEFNIFFELILTLFHLFETRKRETVEDYEFKKIMKKKTKKTLTNLKELDPVLYDYKKPYKSDKVYSRICQKSYQPLLINKPAYDKLPDQYKKNVVKYWNFTTETDAYYHCPNPKYPYIKFITKTHPNDYCIPCCKKIEIASSDKDPKRIIHETCLKDHKYTKEKKTTTIGSKYIMSYGKDIEVGRLSKLPEDTMEGIFYETFSMDRGSSDQSYLAANGFYLYGTQQHTASVADVGYIHSLAHALELSVSQLVDTLISAIKKTPGIFSILLRGRITHYIANYTELIRHLTAFKSDADFLTEAHNKTPWNKLFMDLAFNYLNINTILFQHTDNIDLRLPNGLEDVADYILKSKKNIIILQRDDKYYPVYLINTDLFFKLGIIEKKLFISQDGIVKIIENIVRKYIKTVQIKGKTYSSINLVIIKEFMSNEHIKAKYEINKLFINHSNYCYGIQFLVRGSKHVYVPIEQSYYSFDISSNLEFNPYIRKKAEYAQTFDDLMGFIDDFNKWVDIQAGRADVGKDQDIYQVIRVDTWLVLQKGLDFQETDPVIGFRSSNLNYYFSDMSHKDAMKRRRVKSVPLFYDPDLINTIIHGKDAPKPDTRTTNMSRILYKYNAYQLFLLEFLNVFSKHQNIEVRTQLKKILLGDIVKNMGGINAKISEIVKDSEDLIKIRVQLSDYINNHHDRKQLYLDIDNSRYTFDKVIMHRLMEMSLDKLIKELKKISKPFVKIGKIPDEIVFPNMFSSCQENSLGYCKNRSLILSQANYDTYIDILANDILNPIKQKWIFSDVMSDRVVEFLQFINRPNESIYVTVV